MIRILFVDDETDLLAGLRRLLRGHRDRWEMYFESDPRVALETVAVMEFDVVVSDMRMPGIDGAELLRQVRNIQPGAVRIVLSGQAELTSAIRSLPIAHQFLAKPCDSERLEAAIERSIALSDQLSDPDIRRAVGAVDALPSPSATVLALQEELSRIPIDALRVAALVRSDLAISVKLLQIVNSAFFGLPRTVTDPDEAINYLGAQTIGDVVIATELLKSAQARTGSRDAEIATLQARAQRRADTALELAKRCGQLPSVARLAWVGAFLADVGTLLVSHLDELPEYKPRPALGTSGDLASALGAYLISIWGLPHELVETVALQHEVPSPTSPTVAGLVWAAQQVMDDVPAQQIFEAGAHVLGISIADLQSVSAEQDVTNNAKHHEGDVAA